MLRTEIESLLAEGCDNARTRAAAAFDRIAGALAGSLVLHGAGGLGRGTLAGLRRVGIEPVAFSDNNPCLHGRRVEGVEVLAPAEAARRHGDSSTFVITTWRETPADRMSGRVRQLSEMGCRAVATFGPLYWKYPEIFLPYFPLDLPHRVHEQSAPVIQAAGLWADARSRAEYLAQVRWRLSLDFDSMPDAAPETIYFPEDLFALTGAEVLADCGAYDGDTLRPFLRKTGGSFTRIYAFEPDPANFTRLEEFVSAQNLAARVSLRNACVGEQTGTVRFSAAGTQNSVAGTGDAAVECVRLDDVLENPTHIKMDIEGYEPNALMGAREVIRRHHPVLAISAYHAQDHLWKIPLLIHSLDPDYRLYLRAHARDFFDLVCYAVHPARR